MSVFWVGKDLDNLLNLSIDDLCKIYPQIKRSALIRTRNKKRLLLKEGKVEQQPKPVQPTEEVDPTLVSVIDGWWEVVTANPNDPENPTVTRVHKHSTKTRPNASPEKQLSSFISQADPVKINPSRRKLPKREYKRIFVFGDSQVDYRQIDDKLYPIHDERALSVVRLMCRDLQPDLIVNIGDTLDLAVLSKFDKTSDHFDHSMQPAINRVHRMYAELRADNPETRIVETDSNHNTRLKKFMLKYAPPLYNLRQAGVEQEYPTMSYPFLVNLAAVNVEWVSGYGGAELVYGEEYDAPPIVFKHGNTTGPNTANKEAADNPYTHIVRGHDHRPQVTHRTNRLGQYLTYMVVGCTCSVTGDVEGVHSAVDDHNRVVHIQQKWQQSVAVITDYKDGTYQFDNVMINNGIAKYNGTVYDANNYGNLKA